MAIDVLVCAIAGDCCDAGAIDLRNSVGQTVGYYAIGSVGVGKWIKEKQGKRKKVSSGVEMVMALYLAYETYHMSGNL